jgi:TPP-dependent indolepyruvate ferredoxin oxidoreductase alpha subunit
MKIYVRERQKVREGVRQPMFRILAVTGGQVQIEGTHFRKIEIETIAKDVGADIVYLEEVPDDQKKKH